MKSGSRPLLRTAALSASLVFGFSSANSVFAIDYQWRGTTDNTCTTVSNWTGTGIAATGSVSTPLAASHRLNVNSNTIFNEAVYTAA